jgi:hypothetical protein
MKTYITIVFSIACLGLGHAASAACVAPPASIVGWWTGDETAEDLINGNNGVLVGDVSYAPGKVDAAFSPGIGGQVQIPNSPGLEMQVVTLEAWVRSPADPGPYKYIAAKGAEQCEAASYALYTGPNGGLIFYIWDGTNFYRSPDAGAYAGAYVWDGAWHHVAGIFDGSNVRLFVDGVEVESPGTPVPSIQYGLSTSNDLLIGNYSNAACPGSGDLFSFDSADIDEVAVYNSALSLGDIEAIHHAGSDGKCKTLSIAIDVKPGSDPNCFNINGRGVIPVAILGSDELDVGQIDTSTLTFGGFGVRVRGKKGPLCSIDYSDADAYLDMVCQFEDQPDMWVEGNSEASLTGSTTDGRAFEGSDSVCVVP